MKCVRYLRNSLLAEWNFIISQINAFLYTRWISIKNYSTNKMLVYNKVK